MGFYHNLWQRKRRLLLPNIYIRQMGVFGVFRINLLWDIDLENNPKAIISRRGFCFQFLIFCFLSSRFSEAGRRERRPIMSQPLSVQWRKDQIPQDLVDLHNHLESLPMPWREKLLPLCERVGHFSRLQAKLVQIAQDAVDQLQLDTKYLMYDLETTRRERDEFKEILEALEEEQE